MLVTPETMRGPEVKFHHSQRRILESLGAQREERWELASSEPPPLSLWGCDVMLLGLVGWKEGVCAVAGKLPPPPG